MPLLPSLPSLGMGQPVTGWTGPEEIERRRRMAEALLLEGMGAEPIAHPLQGAAKMAQALMGGLAVRRAGKEEREGRAAGAKAWESLPGLLAGLRGTGAPDTGPATTGSVAAPAGPAGYTGGGPTGGPAAAVPADVDMIVRTVYGEAAGEPPEGQAAVANVILNRAKQSGMSPREVVLAKNQFEPWGSRRKQLEALDPNSPKYQAILANIAPALAGQDVTGGATHFYAPVAQKALGRSTPSWARGPSQDIGAHRFYALGYGGGGKHGIPGGESAEVPGTVPVGITSQPPETVPALRQYLAELLQAEPVAPADAGAPAPVPGDAAPAPVPPPEALVGQEVPPVLQPRPDVPMDRIGGVPDPQVDPALLAALQAPAGPVAAAASPPAAVAAAEQPLPPEPLTTGSVPGGDDVLARARTVGFGNLDAPETPGGNPEMIRQLLEREGIDTSAVPRPGGGGGGMTGGVPTQAYIAELMGNPWVDPQLKKLVLEELFPAPGEGFTLSPDEDRFDAAGNLIASGRPKDPDLPSEVREYEFYVQQESAEGRKPLSFNEWRLLSRKAGASNVIVEGQGEVGTIPQGWELITDPATGARTMRPIPGGPEDPTEKRAAQEEQEQAAGDIVIDDTGRALEIIAKSPGWSHGPLAGVTKNIGGPALDLDQMLDSIKANLSFEKLIAMKQASPTGGALGAVSDTELRLLSAAAGSLDVRQGDALEYNIKRIRNMYLDALYGKGKGPPREKLTREKPAEEMTDEEILEGLR